MSGTTEALLGLASNVVANQKTTPGGTGAAGTGATATATGLLGALATNAISNNIPRSAPVNAPKSSIHVGVVGNQTSASNSQDNDDGDRVSD